MEINQMGKEKALQIIEEGLNIANTKGAFNIKDASILVEALRIVISAMNELDSFKNQQSASKEIHKSKLEK